MQPSYTLSRDIDDFIPGSLAIFVPTFNRAAPGDNDRLWIPWREVISLVGGSAATLRHHALDPTPARVESKPELAGPSEDHRWIGP